MRNQIMNIDKSRFLRLVSVALLLIPYFLYIVFVIHINRGPVDYETFMEIGGRLLSGSEVYGENSFYPMPYVMVFAVFSWLPRPVSMAIWLLAPVLTALLITGGNPLVLLFAPLFGHFVGGQSAIFGMIGLWGYRKNMEPDKLAGGLFLGLTLLKPQLGIIPVAYACIQWWRSFRVTKRIPGQALAWVATMLAIYLPGFALMPDWPVRWLSHPRSLFERAMSGFIPRTLLYLFPSQPILYWSTLISMGTLLLAVIWWINRKTLSLDLAVLWGFVVSPLVHDYDLIQLVPLLENPRLSRIAILLSIPGWLVILFAYRSNLGWYVFTLIAPGLLGAWLYQRQISRGGKKLLQEAGAN